MVPAPLPPAAASQADGVLSSGMTPPPDAVILPPVPPESAKPKSSGVRAEPPTLGRGGAEHKRLQRVVKELAEGRGWSATIEMPLPAGGSVDVGLARAGIVIVCEIAITTPVEKEVANLAKCLAGGVDHVVSLSADRAHLEKIRSAAEARLAQTGRERLHFLSPDELPGLIERIDAGLAATERRSKGLRVRVRFQAEDGNAGTARKRDISGAVVDSIEELRRRENERKRQGGEPPKQL